MKILINRDQSEPTDCKYLKIITESGTEIRISENKFGEVVINKDPFSSTEGTLIIIPQTSNEIIIK